MPGYIFLKNDRFCVKSITEYMDPCFKLRTPDCYLLICKKTGTSMIFTRYVLMSANYVNSISVSAFQTVVYGSGSHICLNLRYFTPKF